MGFAPAAAQRIRSWPVIDSCRSRAWYALAALALVLGSTLAAPTSADAAPSCPSVTRDHANHAVAPNGGSFYMGLSVQKAASSCNDLGIHWTRRSGNHRGQWVNPHGGAPGWTWSMVGAVAIPSHTNGWWVVHANVPTGTTIRAGSIHPDGWIPSYSVWGY